MHKRAGSGECTYCVSSHHLFIVHTDVVISMFTPLPTSRCFQCTSIATCDARHRAGSTAPFKAAHRFAALVPVHTWKNVWKALRAWCISVVIYAHLAFSASRLKDFTDFHQVTYLQMSVVIAHTAFGSTSRTWSSTPLHQFVSPARMYPPSKYARTCGCHWSAPRWSICGQVAAS